MKTLAVFDFDWTLIDEDCDRNVFARLSPELLKKLYELTGVVQWTELIHSLLKELHEKGFTEKDITKAQEEIEFKSETKKMLQTLADNSSELLIISDANEIFIDTILRKQGIRHLFRGIITNGAHYDDSGRLHLVKRLQVPHSCENPCAVNLCKGQELLDFLKNKTFDRILYAGDGKNDFCPGTKLSEKDYFLVRKGHSLEKVLESKKSMLKCNILEWETQQDLLDHICSLNQ